MKAMSIPTVTLLREALTDRDTCQRYWSHVVPGSGGCRMLWCGAISGKGHGRFWVGDIPNADTGKPRSVSVIAHRFRYALEYGIDLLLTAELLSHSCDNPLCQTLEHLRPRTNAENRAEWAQRRHSPTNPLRDRRGARGRADEIRAALRAHGDVPGAINAGLGDDLRQDPLWK